MKNISLFKAPVNALSTFQMLTVLIKVMQKKNFHILKCLVLSTVPSGSPQQTDQHFDTDFTFTGSVCAVLLVLNWGIFLHVKQSFHNLQKYEIENKSVEKFEVYCITFIENILMFFN